MGKGQSKEKQKKVLDDLSYKDWKVVQKEDPSAVTPLCHWVKQYGYNSKLFTK